MIKRGTVAHTAQLMHVVSIEISDAKEKGMVQIVMMLERKIRWCRC